MFYSCCSGSLCRLCSNGKERVSAVQTTEAELRCAAYMLGTTKHWIGTHDISTITSAHVVQIARSGAAMFRNTFQSGFLSILYSIGSKPLQIWDKQGTNLMG